MPQYYGTNRRAAGSIHSYTRFLPIEFLGPSFAFQLAGVSFFAGTAREMQQVIDAENRADILVRNLKKPRPDLFETAWWQFFYATSTATALFVGDPESVEAAFVAHPEYDAAIITLCLGFGTSAQDFCEEAGLPMPIGAV
jgi:hypothetical protein